MQRVQTYLVFTFCFRRDDRVHLVHVGADPLQPHAEDGHGAHQQGQGPVLVSRLLVSRVFADVEDRSDAGDDADHCEDDGADVESCEAYLSRH